ncbi:MAG: heme exporter protein CcmB [Ekhidna sp.]|nr:heme exporter protein CcmB [Ekhidna sp.]
MQRIVQLIRKDLVVDWRQQNPFSGILLYLTSTIFASYMAFAGYVSLEVWNTLFWIIMLFTSVNAISKSFIQEERRSHYYFFLCKPHEIILGKLIYSFLYLLAVGCVALFLYSILLGNPLINYPLFLLNLILGCLGLSSAFTMVSAIAFRTSNRSIMMAVLGFPVIIPVLVLSINNSYKILDSFILMQIQGNLTALFSVDVIIIALTFVLFPFIWKS